LTYRVPSSNGMHKGDGNAQNIVIFQMGGGVNLDDPATPEDESAPVPAGEALYSFDVAAGAAGTTITIDDLIGPGMGAGDVNPYGPYPLTTALASNAVSLSYDIVPLTLVVVPEPATIALLGLGMLAFLRKNS